MFYLLLYLFPENSETRIPQRAPLSEMKIRPMFPRVNNLSIIAVPAGKIDALSAANGINSPIFFALILEIFSEVFDIQSKGIEQPWIFEES